jgi:uncharacterized OsmC-like protein
MMGIKAGTLDVSLEGTTAIVTKTMTANPRRISRIDIEINMSPNLNEKFQKILENTARTCPVLYSLHPDIEKVIVFNWG